MSPLGIPDLTWPLTFVGREFMQPTKSAHSVRIHPLTSQLEYSTRFSLWPQEWQEWQKWEMAEMAEMAYHLPRCKKMCMDEDKSQKWLYMFQELNPQKWFTPLNFPLGPYDTLPVPLPCVICICISQPAFSFFNKTHLNVCFQPETVLFLVA